MLGDAAYHTHARQQRLQANRVKARLMRRANKHHPHLPARLKAYNRLISRQRVAVDTAGSPNIGPSSGTSCGLLVG